MPTGTANTPVVIGDPEPVAEDDIVATVNGRHISRKLLTDVLIRSHGAALLEQLLGLQTAWRAAADRGLTITEGDIHNERDQSLKRMAIAAGLTTNATFDREAAEQLLDAVLTQKNMSPDEFDIIVRRNAYLRKIVTSVQTVSVAGIRREHDRIHGEKVQIRHIQAASLPDINRSTERLRAGESFGEVAQRYSANRATARDQGLLDPFSRGNDDIPQVLRDAAFTLKPGEVSAVLRVGEWYHVIKVEERIPADGIPFEAAREEAERSLRERLAEPAMYALFEKLFRSATIEIRDAGLRAAFERKHPDRAR